MWEKKTDDGTVHDKDNNYARSTTGTAPDGTAFTSFLGELNDCRSPDPTGPITGGFAGHCDWRLPDMLELQTILFQPPPCGSSPCIDPIFGPGTPAYTAPRRSRPSRLRVKLFIGVARMAKRAVKIMRSLGGQTPSRITEVPYIRDKHRGDDIPADAFRRKSVGSKSNCIACHTTAGKGTYEEDYVKIPK